MKNDFAPAEPTRSRVGRRQLLNAALVSGLGAATASEAEGQSLSRIISGPITDVFPDLTALAENPDISRFLLGLDPAMIQLGALQPPSTPPTDPLTITDAERESIREAISQVASELGTEMGLTQDAIQSAAQSAYSLVSTQLLDVTQDQLEMAGNGLAAADLAATPITLVAGDTFVLLDRGGPNAFIFSPVTLAAQDDKLVAKIGILAGLAAAILAFILGVLSIKVPSVNTAKLEPAIAKALRSPVGRTAFTTLLNTIKTEGATIGEKIAAILDWLKTLWSINSVRTMLGEMLSSFNILDLLITIAGVAGIFLTGGTGVIVRLSAAALGLISALIGAGLAYEKAQGM
jgi:hypothetical protein